MYERITDENPYVVPMRIYPAIHYTMGGLWVDYDLMTTIPGLYVIGEANFADQGANRLGASALMQGLADGYFVLPYTIGNYLAGLLGTPVAPTDAPEFQAGRARPGRRRGPVAGRGRHQVGRPLPPRAGQDHVGLLRHGPRQGRPREGAVGDPRPARRVRARRAGAGFGRHRQPVAREGPAGGRLLRAGRAHVPRCPHPRRELRRPLPGRAPDRGGRGPARRRATSASSAPGTGRAEAPHRCCTRNRSSSNTSTSPRGATSESAPPGVAPGRAWVGRSLRGLRRRRRQGGDVVPGDARPGQRAPHRGRPGTDRVRLAIAARASAARAGS